MTCWGQRKAPGFWSLKLKKLALRADKDIKIKGQIYPTTSFINYRKIGFKAPPISWRLFGLFFFTGYVLLAF